MSALNIKAIKSEYLEFTNFTGTTPNFVSTPFLHVNKPCKNSSTAVRYIVDKLIKEWNVSVYGTVPTHFMVKTPEGEVLYEVRPVSAGEAADYVSPSLGDYYFKVVESFS